LIGQNEFNIANLSEERKVIVFDFGDFTLQSQLLLGNIVSKTLLSYYEHKQEGGNPLLFIVDEFSNFINSDFDRLLTEARKFNIGLVLCGHSFVQLDKKLAQLAKRCYSKLLFSLGAEDETAINKEMKKTLDFNSLKKFQCFWFLGKEYRKIWTYRKPLNRYDWKRPIVDYVKEAKNNSTSHYFVKNDWIKT
jgi:hypothetical protein